MMTGTAKRLLAPLYAPLRSWLSSILEREEANAILLGQTLSHHIRSGPDLDDVRQAEFQVFSQFGEDGLIQYLISRVPIERELFVEFGVGNYTEANTRFLLLKDKWSGLIIDSDEASIASVERRKLSENWRLQRRVAFITSENINDIIRSADLEGDIGILSVDIDGNDYWVWKAIDAVRPRIVISEMNMNFGLEHAITVPYRPDFTYDRSTPYNLYHGASLPALCHLADEKGYDFVGCTSEGVNAFFVRKDVSGRLRKLNPKDAYAQIKVVKYGSAPRTRKLRPIQHLDVYDVAADKTLKISELLQ